MKNKLLLFTIIIVLGILPVVSFAEANTDTGSVKNTIESEIDAKKESIKSSVEERRQNAIDKIKERVDQFIQNIIERFNAANSRLEKLADRIDSRIAKMEAKNIDVTKARGLMVIARTKIDIATTSVAAIINIPTDALPITTATIKADFKIVKAQIEKAKEDIRAAHAALVDVVESLKSINN